MLERVCERQKFLLKWMVVAMCCAFKSGRGHQLYIGGALHTYNQLICRILIYQFIIKYKLSNKNI